jgi:glycosyltransferase involved in cell wall biosynthesis
VYGLNAVLCALKTLPLARSLVGTRVALVHAHFANIPAEVAFFLGLLLPSRVTFSVHARDVFVAPARLAQKCRSADVVFACSRSAAERVRSLTGATNVEVVHHGLDFSDPTWDEVYAYRRRFPEQREARGRPLRLLGVGRFVRKKGFHVLIEALAVLRREGVCFDCLLVGGGPERPSLQARVDRLQLGEQVRLADFMPEILRSPQWRDCDLLVHPSVIAEDADRDGIPNVILEAFACGVPVLASDLDSIREVIDPGRTGFLAPAGQPRELAAAIVDALGSAEQIREITANARGEVRSRFDADRNVLEMLQRWHVAAR